MTKEPQIAAVAAAVEPPASELQKVTEQKDSYAQRCHVFDRQVTANYFLH
jgi:hypothetical protein